MKRRPKAKTMKPIEARTFNQVCSLPRSSYDTKHFWLVIDGAMVIGEQEDGQAATNKLVIPRAEFDRLVRWYMTGKATK